MNIRKWEFGILGSKLKLRLLPLMVSVIGDILGIAGLFGNDDDEFEESEAQPQPPPPQQQEPEEEDDLGGLFD